MPRKPATPPVDTEVYDFVIHGGLAPRLIEWLNSQGFDVINWPTEPDQLPAFMVTPGEDLMRRVP